MRVSVNSTRESFTSPVSLNDKFIRKQLFKFLFLDCGKTGFYLVGDPDPDGWPILIDQFARAIASIGLLRNRNALINNRTAER